MVEGARTDGVGVGWGNVRGGKVLCFCNTKHFVYNIHVITTLFFQIETRYQKNSTKSFSEYYSTRIDFSYKSGPRSWIGMSGIE